MFILFGIGKKTLEKHQKQEVVCSVCKSQGMEYRAIQRYFHIFWIPFFPIGRKFLTASCRQCNTYYETTNKAYVAHLKTPRYLFTGLFLLAIPFLLLTVLFIVSLFVYVPITN